MIAKFMGLVLTLVLIVSTSVLTMIYGWGVHPRSWWWIIGVGFFGQIALAILADAVKKDLD